jgi:hypothetical protein
VRYAPHLEWGLAAQWWGESWERFCAMDGDDQAFLIAVYRTKTRLDAVIQWDQRPKQKKT